MSESYITISGFGFDKRAIERLSQVLGQRISNVQVVDSMPDAQLFLFNLEARNATDLYKKFMEKNQAIPAIGLCSDEGSGWSMRKIRMPVNIDELVNSIGEEIPEVRIEQKRGVGICEDKVKKAMEAIETRQVASKLKSKISQDKPGVVKPREIVRKTDEMCFDTDRFLLGKAIEAVKTLKQGKTAALIRCWGDKTILIRSADKRVLTDLSDNQIRNMMIAPLDDKLSSAVSIDYVDSGDLDKVVESMPKNSRSISLESFMWDLGMMTCKGRIPEEISIADRHYLRRWPNVTRVKLPENGLKIIAYWVRQPCSLDEIRQKTEVPLQDIFSVFTAAYAAGLADRAARHADKLVEVEDIRSSQHRGLFNSIMNRLKSVNKDVA